MIVDVHQSRQGMSFSFRRHGWKTTARDGGILTERERLGCEMERKACRTDIWAVLKRERKKDRKGLCLVVVVCLCNRGACNWMRPGVKHCVCVLRRQPVPTLLLTAATPALNTKAAECRVLNPAARSAPIQSTHTWCTHKTFNRKYVTHHQIATWHCSLY